MNSNGSCDLRSLGGVPVAKWARIASGCTSSLSTWLDESHQQRPPLVEGVRKQRSRSAFAGPDLDRERAQIRSKARLACARSDHFAKSTQRLDWRRTGRLVVSAPTQHDACLISRLKSGLNPPLSARPRAVCCCGCASRLPIRARPTSAGALRGREARWWRRRRRQWRW